MAAFMTVHAGSYGGLQEKSFSKRFKFLLFTLIILPLPKQSEIHATAIKILLIFEAGLFIRFIDGLASGFKSNEQAFTAEYRKRFGRH